MTSQPTRTFLSPRREFVAVGALVAVTAVWGSTFLIVQDVVEIMPVFAFLAWRFSLATLVLIAIRPSALRGLTPAVRNQGIGLGVALGLGYIFQTIGLKSTSATVSGFITGMFVVFTPLISAVVLRARITPIAWLAVGLASVGLGLLSLNGFSIGIGELLTLMCAFLFAVQIVGLGLWARADNVYALAVLQLGTAAVIALVASLPSGGPVAPPSKSVWVAVLFLALVATAAAFFIQTWAQSQLPATRAAIVLTMEPVFAGFTGVVVGGEPLTVRIVLGAGFILAAMYLVELGPRAGAEATLPHLEP